MKLLSYFVLTAVLLSIGAPVVVAQEAVEPWGEQVAPGIEYREYRLPTPNNVFVTRMERDNPLVTIESSIGQGRLSGGTETVKGMTQRYDGAINYWGESWGNRNKVVAAINGFYFDYSTGIPRQGQVHSGWYSKLFDPCETGTGGSGFAWKLDRNVFIGESVRNPVNEIHYFRDEVLINNESNLGTISLENIVYLPLAINIIGVLPEPKQVFDGINVERGQDQLILYTSQYGKDTGTDKTDSIEVLVRMTSPSLIRDSKDEDFFPIGIIERIFENRGSTQIPFDHVVLSMHGVKKDEFLAIRAGVGDEIGILQMIKGCNNAPDFSWENTYASIGGAFYFLKDGVINDFSDKGEAKVRDPRTAIAFNDDYIFFIVVDGRDEWYSKGMSIEELAMFTRDELGATHGIAEDGGGSSTMVVNGEVKNNTYCNIVICKGEIYLPLISAAGTKKQIEESPSTALLMPRFPANSSPQPERLSGDGLPLTEEYYTSSQDATGSQLQRLVANGMMMVVVEPKDLSSIFTVGDKIKTLTPVKVRLGPGTNYPSIETIPTGITGVVYGFDNGLNGVMAKGYYWWRVLLEIDGRDVIGWVIEPALTTYLP